MKQDTVYYTIQTTSNDKPYHIGASRYDSEDSARQSLEKILEPGHCGEIVQHTLTVVDTIHCKTPERYPLTFTQAWNLLKYENIFKKVKTGELFIIKTVELSNNIVATHSHPLDNNGEPIQIRSDIAIGYVDFKNLETNKAYRCFFRNCGVADGKLYVRDNLGTDETPLAVLTPAKID